MNRLFKEFYKLHGIINEITTSYLFEINGKLETNNRTLVESIVIIIINVGVVSNWWRNIIDCLLYA